MPLLSDLPAEVLHRITRYLVNPKIGFSDDGLCNLRLTCRALCLKTQYEFGRAAFSTLRLDLHPKTLQRLLTICRLPAFGEAVKKIVLAHWGDEYITFPLVSDDARGEKRLEDQVLFVMTKIFEESFNGMPSLKEIVMVTPCIARFRRHQYNLDAGFPKSAQDGGALTVEEFCLTLDRLYVLVGKALATTRIQISALETTGPLGPAEQRYWRVWCISTHSLKATAQALRGMQHLKITVDTSETLNADEFLGDALRDLSLLTRLDIRFHSRASNLAPSLDSGWRASGAAALKPLQNIHFPRLTNLALRTARIDECVLKDFVLAHQKTLERIALYHVTLEQDACWGSILACMLDNLGRLEELCMANSSDARAGLGTFDLMGRIAIEQRLGSMLGRI